MWWPFKRKRKVTDFIFQIDKKGDVTTELCFMDDMDYDDCVAFAKLLHLLCSGQLAGLLANSVKVQDEEVSPTIYNMLMQMPEFNEELSNRPIISPLNVLRGTINKENDE